MDKMDNAASAATIKLSKLQATVEVEVERPIIEHENIADASSKSRNKIPVQNPSNLYSNQNQGSNEPSGGLKSKVFKLKSSSNLELDAPCAKKVAATAPVPESASKPEPGPIPVQDPTAFSCHLCPSERSRAFIDRTSLNKHLRIIHHQELNLDTIYCSICFKEFQNETDYTHHCQTVHSDSYKIQTEIHNKDSRNNNIAATHSCQHCPYTCLTKTSLNQHLEFSKKCRRSLFKCGKCPEASPNFFISKYLLYKHATQVHPASRKKRISQQSIILIPCGICPQTFIDQSTRATHIRSIHDEEDLSRLRCDICSKQFDRRMALKNHLKWEHSINFLCDVCSKSFGNEALFAEHNALVKKPDFICQICEEKCESACGLNVHTDNHLNDLRVQAGSSLFTSKK